MYFFYCEVSFTAEIVVFSFVLFFLLETMEIPSFAEETGPRIDE